MIPQVLGTVVLFLLSAGMIFLGVVVFVQGRGNLSGRMQTYIDPVETNLSRGTAISGFQEIRAKLNEWLSILVSPESEMKLMSAHWPITNVEYILLRWVATLMAFLLGWLAFQNLIPGLGLALLIFVTPPIFLRWSINRRQQRFNNQLVDVLVLLTGGIRAGYSFLQAMDHVIQELPPPVSVELGRVRHEIRLGVSIREALQSLAERMDNKDLSLVVTAIIISQQVGGNMTQMMEVVTDTIRARTRLFNEVQSLTSQQRFTGQLLTFLPVIVAGILFLVNPTYMSRIFDPQLIWLPIGAGVSILIGNIIVRSLVNFDY